MPTSVKAEENPQYSTDPGNDTQDQVFLLSISEAYQYFASDDDRICTPTALATANGEYVSSGSCWWWLRSPGGKSYDAAGVDESGAVTLLGHYVHYVNHSFECVRPALWVDVSNL